MSERIRTLYIGDVMVDLLRVEHRSGHSVQAVAREGHDRDKAGMRLGFSDWRNDTPEGHVSAVEQAFDALMRAMGRDVRWADPLPGRDDLLLEMRAAADGLKALLDSMRAEHARRQEELRGNEWWVEHTLEERLDGNGTPVLAPVLSAYANLLVALHAAKPARGVLPE